MEDDTVNLMIRRKLKVIKSPEIMQNISVSLKQKGKRIGFVPTMGALHEGHFSLIRRARRDNDAVIVSIFVNPLQFAPNEDFRQYPRQMNKDKTACRRLGVDYVFYPEPNRIYPAGFKTHVKVKDLSDKLCGITRPGHFEGVATIVTILFNITQPDTVYFGQKDAQQSIIISRIVRDLRMPLKVKVLPIVRERYGLALSSRNKYLNEKEKEDALVLNHALKAGRDMITKEGIRQTSVVINRLRQMFRKKNARVEYIALVDTQDLLPVKKIKGKCLLAAAIRIGSTRLIDNMLVG